MKTITQHYDRVLTACIAIVTLTVSAVLAVKSLAIAKKFPAVEAPPQPEVELSPIQSADEAARHFQQERQWMSPRAADGGATYRAFASVPVFWHEGELVDVYGGPPIRGNVPNRWLVENGLPIERADVLALDPDRDGFTSGEEFFLDPEPTNPLDRSSHPDRIHKLSLANVTTEAQSLKFVSNAGNEFSVRRYGDPQESGRPKTNWVKVGDLLPGGRHRLIEFEDNAVAGERVLTILDTVTDKQIRLKRGVVYNLPIYRAVLAFPFDEAFFDGKEFQQGDTFIIPGPKIRCSVGEVTADSVTLDVHRPDGRHQQISRSR